MSLFILPVTFPVIQMVWIKRSKWFLSNYNCPPPENPYFGMSSESEKALYIFVIFLSENFFCLEDLLLLKSFCMMEIQKIPTGTAYVFKISQTKIYVIMTNEFLSIQSSFLERE